MSFGSLSLGFLGHLANQNRQLRGSPSPWRWPPSGRIHPPKTSTDWQPTRDGEFQERVGFHDDRHQTSQRRNRCPPVATTDPSILKTRRAASTVSTRTPLQDTRTCNKLPEVYQLTGVEGSDVESRQGSQGLLPAEGRRNITPRGLLPERRHGHRSLARQRRRRDGSRGCRVG